MQINPNRLLTLLWVFLPTALLAAPGDADNDGLRDEVETGTGIYVSPSNTGTNPAIADTDEDSLPDGMEVGLGTNPVDASSKVKRPNIIYILCDDLGYGDVGCFWQNQRTGTWKFQTPGLDAMAAEGVMMTHHYSAAPICAPARASLLLGQHQGNALIRDIQFDKALPDNHNIASVLKSAGYHTVHVGKAGLAGTVSNPLLSSANLEGHPLKRGFDRFFGYLRHEDGHEHYPRNGTAARLAVIHDDYQPVTGAYQDLYTGDAWTAFAKKTIIEDTTQHPDRPFFLYLSYDTPHFYGSASPTATYPANKGKNGGIQWTGAPAYANTAINSAARVNSQANVDPSVLSSWPSQAKNHVSMIRRIDDSVSDILQTLRDLGIADNTLVVFSSDNGPTDTETSPAIFQSYAGFEGMKFDLWEGGIRVPTIAWWPGKITGTNQLSNIRKVTEPSANWDWMATFSELARVQCPATTDGISLLPDLTGAERIKKRDFLFFDTLYGGNTNPIPDFPNHGGELRYQMQAIRIGDLMGVRYNIQTPFAPFRIYNVVTDPKESVDLSATMPDLQSRLLEIAVGARRKGDGGWVRIYEGARIPAVTRSLTKPGLTWSGFEGQWPWLPDYKQMKPTRTGITAMISASNLTRNDDAGLSFTGYLSVPTDGNYTFELNSNNSASLWIHEGLAIDNDYLFTPTKTSAPINLAAGLHPIRLYYRHQGGTAALNLKYSGPGIPMQQVPASAFFVEAAAAPLPPPLPPPDRDGDGVSDDDELVAGTNPDDPQSFLRVESISNENGNVILHWAGVAGRTYRVQESDDLGNWVAVPDLNAVVVVESTGDVSVSILENGSLNRFFRVLASITPPQPPSDQDRDGYPDETEVLAGTNPNDPNSYFKIHTFDLTEIGTVLQWSGVAGRTYRVEESPNLTTWTLVPGLAPIVMTSTTPNASVTVPKNGVTQRFLRMQVMLTP